MTTTKHTPGPWHTQDVDHLDGDDGGGACVVWVTAARANICQVVEDDEIGPTIAAMKANAALIAAAPNLLAACERLTIAAEVFAGSEPDMPTYKADEREFEEALKEARAAIAKAKGATP